ncbi:MAG: Hsp20/alpha crystallin family protein [Proteobacteria bacterium]|nr:Hsp20/alpha crystallin family protein [Pseudomonadota bacterium]
MNIVYRHPWHSGRLHDEFRHACGRLFNDGDGSSAATAQWTPRVDIREEDKRFVILADIPGVEPKDIEVSMDKGVLSIKGERNFEGTAENANATRSERFHGAFHRQFALPDSADADGISASGKHGVLEISIPKKAELAPRKIAVTH